ncbi:MAG: hypothetical protein JSR90_10120 [Proteobacteria bacterium]|nr:hypothetical protein [Pseudomonadota bacterium]
MTDTGFRRCDQIDDIGTVTDWLIILLVYFTVMACLIVPIAMAAKARSLDEGVGLSSTTDIVRSAGAANGDSASPR